MDLGVDSRMALATEFDWTMAGLFKPIRSTFPNVRDPDPYGYSARTVITKMGPADECFAGVVDLQPPESLNMYRAMRFGDGAPAVSYQRILAEVFSSLASRHPLLSIVYAIPYLAKAVVTEAARLVSPFLTSLVRHPEGKRSKVATSVLNATRQQFEVARVAHDILVRFFRRLGYRKVATSLLLHPKWRVMSFCVLVHLVSVWEKRRGSLPSIAEIEADRTIFFR
jgi:hypothetical protein